MKQVFFSNTHGKKELVFFDALPPQGKTILTLAFFLFKNKSNKGKL